MGKGFKHGGAGGGSELGFRVISGTVAPAAPRENDIWVNTESMTGWCFSAEEPEAAEGLVWVTVGSSSGVAFNALRKNTLMVYPISAKQYTGGEWVARAAQSWQGGEWVSWWAEGTLFENGVDDTDVTGGWTSYPYIAATGYYAGSANVSISGDAIRAEAAHGGISAASNWSVFVSTVNALDLTDKTLLEMKFSEAVASIEKTAIVAVRIYTDAGVFVAEGPTVLSSDGTFTPTVTMDVSGVSGKLRVGYAIWSWNKSSVVTVKMTRARVS